MDRIDEIQRDKSVSDIWPYTFAAPKSQTQSLTHMGSLNDSAKDKEEKKFVGRFELPFLNVYKPFQSKK